MDTHEIIRRTDTALDTFADRVPERHVEGLREMAEVGERGELVSNLIAALANANAPVTAAERGELRELADATGEGHDWLGQLTDTSS